jgi:hypothetical protein
MGTRLFHPPFFGFLTFHAVSYRSENMALSSMPVHFLIISAGKPSASIERAASNLPSYTPSSNRTASASSNLNSAHHRSVRGLPQENAKTGIVDDIIASINFMGKAGDDV